jgi:hypothetical protein
VKQLVTQLVRGRSLLSRGIGYWGRGFYSHIDVVTPLGLLRGARSDEILGIESGVRDRPQNYETWARCTRYTIDLTDAQWEVYWEFSDKQVGKPYDTDGVIRAFVFGRDWRDDSNWWCSELWARNLEVPRVIQIAPEINAITPGDCGYILAGLKAVRKEMPCQ